MDKRLSLEKDELFWYNNIFIKKNYGSYSMYFL
jgi:hypothetical protein